jgi:hypothetical protein
MDVVQSVSLVVVLSLDGKEDKKFVLATEGEEGQPAFHNVSKNRKFPQRGEDVGNNSKPGKRDNQRSTINHKWKKRVATSENRKGEKKVQGGTNT